MRGEQSAGTVPPIPEPRLIAHVVSERAINAPNTIWASIPKSQTDPSIGFENITFARLNYAITRAARWMQDRLDLQGSLASRALAYVGPPDTRYIILTIAAIKTGSKMLYLSPRNSDEAQLSVIEQASCETFLYAQSMDGMVQKLRQSHPRLSGMVYFVVPEQEELLKDDFIPDFPYEREIHEAREDPLVILHTSSTTGMPKTIHLNQGYGMHEDILQHIPKFNNLDIITRKTFYGPCRMFVAMPLYHAGGVLLTLLKSLYQDIVSVFQPPAAALNAEMFEAILRHGQCNGCVIPPYTLEEMLTEPRYFDTLARLDFVQFGSGPLSKVAGDTLLKRQKNCPHFIGSSECGLYILLELDDPTVDWQYFRFHPWCGAEMRPLDSTKQICELFIVRSDAPKVPGVQPVFELFPNIKDWPTKELYARHPSKPDHWKYVGRNDDVLVLSNGEKLNPVDVEGRIGNAHPSVTGALVIGQGRFAPGLLLEVRDVDTSDALRNADLITTIWPLVQAANHDAPKHGRLSQELILLTTACKPFLRTPKLSIRRKPTIDLYADEIDQMYDRYSTGIEDNNDGSVDSLNLASVSHIQAFLSRHIQSENGWDKPPGAEADLFMLGMDSLQVARMARIIKAAFARQGIPDGFDARVIYNNATLKGLSEAISLKAGMTHATDDRSAPGSQIDALIEEYSQFDSISRELNGMKNGYENAHRRPINILLTGSTGSLGSHILLALLERPQVAHVYCLNRAEDAKSRQFHMLSEQGVDASRFAALESRIHLLHSTSLDAPRLGLATHDEYELLRNSSITHVIHNAWPVNFNIGLASFKSHVAGVRALVDFSILVPEHPKLIFISSLSSISNLSLKRAVPEAIVVDSTAPSPMGYGQSKYAAEHVLNRASEASSGGIASVILRVGQIAGPVKSSQAAWPAREWLPSLVISSQAVGALPDALGRMDQVEWVPVDLLADGISEMLDVPQVWDRGEDRGERKQSSVFHVVNPNAVAWAELVPSMKAQTGLSKIVPLADWVDLVRQMPDNDSTMHLNPAKKILQFYEALADVAAGGVGLERIERGRMARYSNTFKQMQPVSGEWMTKWARQWNRV